MASFSISGALALTLGLNCLAQSQSQPALPSSSIEILLPPRLVAGRPATLATLGADRKLAPHIMVELGNGAHLQTDATGRANFVASSVGVLIAKAGTYSTATLVDPETPVNDSRTIDVPPFASLHNSLEICGCGFQGNAEANHVRINDEPALTLAASPECLVVALPPNSVVGKVNVSVQGSPSPRQTTITLVSLDFEGPRPPLMAQKKSWIAVRASGSQQRLRILVENESPDVLRFEKGDAQALVTSGGADNTAQIKVEAIRSGDFAFRARLLPPADPEAARRFLQAAEPLVTADLSHTLTRMEDDLSRHPRASDKVRAQLDEILTLPRAGDTRALLEAARSVL